MVTTIFFQTFPKLFLPEFQKRNSWIVTVYSNENEEKSEFYNANFIYKHFILELKIWEVMFMLNIYLIIK
ncbi:hypothetical protein [Aliarcobacter cryaerophilus]|uniref:Uncharacterized protein n=1 Tax=Aliarcobacter cryaerophilus TaxID=28198 RepID=A0A2S9SNZ8_9BACT|nr:hypothetical protein [Aliarcobacter cryaerophilus]PRM88317.1 hypothetical protein CJ669_03785 [Aliarcobacter cryaerophilus]